VLCDIVSENEFPFQLKTNQFFLQDVVIQADDEIRLKIVGTRVDASGIVSYSWSTT
jgi:DNA-directed RNA polymerase subunit E'/Rpb7